MFSGSIQLENDMKVFDIYWCYGVHKARTVCSEQCAVNSAVFFSRSLPLVAVPAELRWLLRLVPAIQEGCLIPAAVVQVPLPTVPVAGVF
jgi:hypothetical protein